jgi:hypothetical protein
MNDKQHLEDTKYVQWQDGMYVMLDDLADPLDEHGYVLALVEDSLRGSVYFHGGGTFKSWDNDGLTDCLGVYSSRAGRWYSDDGLRVKLTRAQALYIATGDTDI